MRIRSLAPFACIRVILSLSFALTLVFASSNAVAKTKKPKAKSAKQSAKRPHYRPTFIDFQDDRLIQGQTNKSGAVLLLDRKASNLKSMVKRRTSFRKKTIRSIYDR